MRVAIVNDDHAVAESLRRIVAAQSDLELAWVVFDGEDSVRRCAADTPDLILMDLALPRVDGIEATRQIMDATPCAILIVTPVVSADAARIFRAMGFGALDAVNTPVGQSGEEALLAKIRTIGRLIGKSALNPRTSAAVPRLGSPAASRAAAPLVVIGSSTGGPKALADIFSRMTAPPEAAIVVVQHVDAQFANGLAGWLDEFAPCPVKTVVEGARPRAGEVALAQSNDHLVLAPNLTFRYVSQPLDLAYRPSVNVFFKSVAQVWPGPGIAVLLTGMGSDGGSGLLALRGRGWHTIAQDQATSVIYGMPKAAAELGAAVQVLPVEEIAQAIELQLAALVHTSRVSGSHRVHP
ncbi:MAG TPA: chemotaxis-specific protein-glutamate methyltransferase CheB [Thermoanaerobaculia bacterium]|nr:chemotaxis-specific protein-glutamate methyltransferase CheB [Thermoanaerobaculia bacterium]